MVEPVNALPLIIEALIKIALVIGGLMTAAAYLVLLERWMAAWIQDRVGPNRVGIPLTKIRLFGLGQPLADGVKFLFKSDVTPAQVDKMMYFVAPLAIFTTAIVAFAAIPIGSYLPPEALPSGWGLVQPIQLVIAPGLDVGIVYVFALSSVGVYGVVLGGWAGNDKYSFLGGLRSSAQLIAYEIPLGLGVLGVVLWGGSLRLESIVAAQAESGVWNVVLQPLGFAVFCVASFAEAARLPFDLPEAEQELVGGYHTEYSGIKLMMYLVAEFLHMILAAFLIAILFLGGWHFWGLTDGLHSAGDSLVSWPVALLRIVVLLVKVFGVILFFMLVRWSWPRFRFDQLMRLAWKVMLPLGMANLALVAVWAEYGVRLAGAGFGSLVGMALLGWAALVVGWLVVAYYDPAASDNRPRRTSAFDDFEPSSSPAVEGAPREAKAL